MFMVRSWPYNPLRLTATFSFGGCGGWLLPLLRLHTNPSEWLSIRPQVFHEPFTPTLAADAFKHLPFRVAVMLAVDGWARYYPKSIVGG